MIRGLIYDLPRAWRGARGGILQRCSSLSHSGHVHGGVGARGVRGAVVGDQGGPVAFSGVADELVVAHLVAVATFHIFVGVGFLGAGRGLVGVLVGGGAVAGGLTIAAELIEFEFDGGNTIFIFGFDIFKSGEEVGFVILGGRRHVVLINRHDGQGRGPSFGWGVVDLLRLNGQVEGVVEGFGGLAHNFLSNVWLEAGDEEVEGDVVQRILNAEVDEVHEDLGADRDVEGHERGDGGGFLPRILRESLLVELFHGFNVVDGVDDPDVVLGDSFRSTLQQRGEVDGGGAGRPDDREGIEEAGFERIPVVYVDFGGSINAAGPGEGEAAESVEDVGHGVGVVPPRGVLGALDSSDPLFASECVSLGPGEEGELGEVSLAKIFDLIGHCFIQISKISLQFSKSISKIILKKTIRKR